MVYYRQDCVVPFASWKLGNEVHCYNLEWYRFYWYWNTVRWWRLSMGEDFVLLTGCTSFDILGDPSVHCGPPEGSRNCEDGVVASWVSSCGGIVEVSQYLFLQCFVRWNCYVFSDMPEVQVRGSGGLQPLSLVSALPVLHQLWVSLLFLCNLSF